MRSLYYLVSAIVLAAADDPTIEKSPTVRITAAPGYLDQPLSIVQGWNLSFYPSQPCHQEAYFSPNGSPTIFYVNGTDDEFASRKATLQTDRGGPPASPHGVRISSEPDEEGRFPVFMSCGAGSLGLQVADWPGTVYYETGTMYVCNTTVLGDEGLGLFWHEHGAPTPKDCLGLTLEAWCADDEESALHEFERNSTCYR
jgi:hypothetical protein